MSHSFLARTRALIIASVVVSAWGIIPVVSAQTDDGQVFCCNGEYAAEVSDGLCLPQKVTEKTCRAATISIDSDKDGVPEDYRNAFDDPISGMKRGGIFTNVSMAECNQQCRKKTTLVGCAVLPDPTYPTKYNYQCVPTTPDTITSFDADIPAFSPSSLRYDLCASGYASLTDKGGMPYEGEKSCRLGESIKDCSQLCRPPIDVTVEVACSCNQDKNVCTVTVENPDGDNDALARQIVIDLHGYASPMSILSQAIRTDGVDIPDTLAVINNISSEDEEGDVSTIVLTGKDDEFETSVPVQSENESYADQLRNFIVPAGAKIVARVGVNTIQQNPNNPDGVEGWLGARAEVFRDPDIDNNLASDYVYSSDYQCHETEISSECKEVDGESAREYTLTIGVTQNEPITVESRELISCVQFQKDPETGFVDPEEKGVVVEGCAGEDLTVTPDHANGTVSVTCRYGYEGPGDITQQLVIRYVLDPTLPGCSGGNEKPLSFYVIRNPGEQNEQRDVRTMHFIPRTCDACDACAQFQSQETCEADACQANDTEDECVVNEECMWTGSTPLEGSCSRNPDAQGAAQYCTWNQQTSQCVASIDLEQPENSLCPLYIGCCRRDDPAEPGTFLFGWFAGRRAVESGDTSTGQEASLWENSFPETATCYALDRTSPTGGQGTIFFAGSVPEGEDDPSAYYDEEGNYDPDIYDDSLPLNEQLQRLAEQCETVKATPGTQQTSSRAAENNVDYMCSTTIYLEDFDDEGNPDVCPVLTDADLEDDPNYENMSVFVGFDADGNEVYTAASCGEQCQDIRTQEACCTFNGCEVIDAGECIGDNAYGLVDRTQITDPVTGKPTFNSQCVMDYYLSLSNKLTKDPSQGFVHTYPCMVTEAERNAAAAAGGVQVPGA